MNYADVISTLQRLIDRTSDPKSALGTPDASALTMVELYVREQHDRLASMHLKVERAKEVLAGKL